MLMMLCALLCVAAVWWMLLGGGLEKTKRKEGKLPPGRMGLPFIGETLDFLRTQRKNRSWEFIDYRVAAYASHTFKTHLVGSPTIIVASPAGNKMAFANVHVSWPQSVVNVIGQKCLINAQTGSEAQCLRAAIHAFLNPEALRRYTRPLSRIVLASLPRPPPLTSSRPSSNSSAELAAAACPADVYAEPLLLYPFMHKLTFSIVCHILIGIHDPADQQSLFDHFNTLMKGLLQIPIRFPGTRYSNALAASHAIKARIQSLMDKKRAEITAGGGGASASTSMEHGQVENLLTALLTFKDEEGNPLSEEEIKDNLVLVLFAGNDTSSIVATMTCRYLALYPSIMDEVYKENKDVAEALPAGESSLRWEDLQKLKLTWRVVQETMRLQPPVQGSFRRATGDMNFDGFMIPESWKIYWSVNSTHRNPEYFAEPETFDPSRFEGAGPAPFTFVPFGGGRRMCPGNEFARMEILMIIHHMVTQFSWTLSVPEEAITVDPMPTPVHGLPVRLQPRTTPWPAK